MGFFQQFFTPLDIRFLLHAITPAAVLQKIFKLKWQGYEATKEGQKHNSKKQNKMEMSFVDNFFHLSIVCS